MSKKDQNEMLYYYPVDKEKKVYKILLKPGKQSDKEDRDVSSFNSDKNMETIKKHLQFINDILSDDTHLEFFRPQLKIKTSRDTEGKTIEIRVNRFKRLLYLKELQDSLHTGLFLSRATKKGSSWWGNRLRDNLELDGTVVRSQRNSMIKFGWIEIRDKRYSKEMGFSQRLGINYGTHQGVEFSYRLQKLWGHIPSGKTSNTFIQDKSLAEYALSFKAERHIVAKNTVSKPALLQMKDNIKRLLVLDFVNIKNIASQYFGKPVMYLEHVIREIPEDILLSPRDNNIYEPIIYDFINAYNQVSRNEYLKNTKYRGLFKIRLNITESPAFNKLKRKMGKNLRYRYQFPFSMREKQKTEEKPLQSAWFSTKPPHHLLAPNMVEPIKYISAYYLTAEGNAEYRLGFPIYNRASRQTEAILSYGKRITDYMLSKDFKKVPEEIKQALARRLVNLDSAYRYSSPDVSHVFRRRTEFWKIMQKKEKPKNYKLMTFEQKKKDSYSHWGLVWLRTNTDYLNDISILLLDRLYEMHVNHDVRGALNPYLPLWTACTPKSYEKIIGGEASERVFSGNPEDYDRIIDDVEIPIFHKSETLIHATIRESRYMRRNDFYGDIYNNLIYAVSKTSCEKDIREYIQKRLNVNRVRTGSYGYDKLLIKDVTTRLTMREWMPDIATHAFNTGLLHQLWGSGDRYKYRRKTAYYREINDIKADIRRNDTHIRWNRAQIAREKDIYRYQQEQ